MTMIKTPQQIETALWKELCYTKYAAKTLRPLRGGTANFVYHAQLHVPLPSGVSEVLVKHGEGYVAANPDFAFTTLRCEIESLSMRMLSNLPHVTSPGYDVSTPEMYYFDCNTNTQVHEYLPNAINLKDYALKYYQRPLSTETKVQCIQLGEALGEWLRKFHVWGGEFDGGAQLQAPVMRNQVAWNSDMQALKKTLNYDQLLRMVQEFPGLLEEHEHVLQEIIDMVAAERQDKSRLDVIHGDFWTGNVLLPDAALQENPPTPVKIVDWEMAQLGIRAEDVGQLIAELWQLKLYKGIYAGIWIIEGFVAGYGTMDTAFGFRALLHVGAHMVCFGSRTANWGTRSQNEHIARIGRDVLLRAWEKDRQAFKGHDLHCLLW
ncbi:hypothetical protein E4U09_007532 [Claviceps aff. purpurea]|uniref:Aminoglycoside phosphotransferase domain-containing protein n=1 Tax=Claviceps aff. purpurea TaxID=1967640 RepID=A0A9P7TYY4_9HYPO|nr:hypothetical protein E4U09_007532 [Claviceps aff. purpurea]